jgi:hypothetical protein
MYTVITSAHPFFGKLKRLNLPVFWWTTIVIWVFFLEEKRDNIYAVSMVTCVLISWSIKMLSILSVIYPM